VITVTPDTDGIGVNVFYIEGISTPVTAFQIEGENARSPEEVRESSDFYTKENFRLRD
jgi:hypothetical protein